MHHSVDPGFFNSLSIEKYLLSTNKRYFHYTDAQSAINMLKLINDNEKSMSFLDKWCDAHLEIWATHFRYLNDFEELKHGVKIFLEVLQKSLIRMELKELIEKKIMVSSSYQVREMPYYPLSFCDKGNLLSQWKYYGKECGIAIEYNLKSCQFMGHELHDTPNQIFFLYDVIYGEKNKTSKQTVFKKLIREISSFAETDNNDIADRVVQSVYLLSLFMKHPSFYEEAESRLLFVISKPSELENIKKPVLNFRKRNNIIIPFIKVQIKSNTTSALPIKSITIGPGENQELVYESFYQFILANFPANGFTNDNIILHSDDGCEFIRLQGIELRRSTTPFR